MSQAVEDRVRGIVAGVLDVPPALVRPETALSLADLGWKGFLMIALAIEHAFGIALPVAVPNGWTSVADAILAVERALAEQKAVAARSAA